MRRDSANGQRGVGPNPIRVMEIELAKRLPAIDPVSRTGRAYARTSILARLHGRPLGVVATEIGRNGLTPTEVAGCIWRELAPRINEHLRADGLDQVELLPLNGLLDVPDPQCTAARQKCRLEAPTASIIVATHERPTGLARTLHSLAELDYPSFEIIVVDNAPETSDTFDMLQRDFTHMSRLRYVKEPRRGLTPARVRGLELATGTIVAFTDDDVVVDRQWLAELATGFELGDEIACVTGLTFPLELDTPAQIWFEEYGGFGKGFDQRSFNLGRNRPSDRLFPYAVARVGSGNNMAWRADLLRNIGGFDLALTRTGAEDISAFFDAITNGYTIVYEPGALIFHEHRRDYLDLKRQMYWYGIGLGAYLTRCLMADWKSAVDFAGRAPSGLIYMLNPASGKNKRKSRAYPNELTRLERQGALRGPFTYLRGRREAARTRAG